MDKEIKRLEDQIKILEDSINMSYSIGDMQAVRAAEEEIKRVAEQLDILRENAKIEKENSDRESKQLTEDKSYEELLAMYKEELEELYKLQEKYENGEIEYSEYSKQADRMVELYRFIMSEYNKNISAPDKENKGRKVKWHPKLTDEQKEELIAEGIEPGDNEYDMYLWNHGIDPTIEIDAMKAELEGRKIKDIEKPEQPMMILEKDGKPTPPTPPFVEVEEKPNLPVVSGLQIYNRVLQEIGAIKGTKAIKFHDIMEHVAIIGRPIAWLTEKVTGRKKEMKRIIDAMEGIDFKNEFGISSQAAMDLMLEDFLIKGGNVRNIVKVKANDIFLRALEQKLRKDLPERTQKARELTEQSAKEMANLEEERRKASPDRQQEIDSLLAEIHRVHQFARGTTERLSDQIELVVDGRIKKSYSKKENIEGSDAAVRDPDNREEIAELARIERSKLEAERDGRADDAEIYAQRMTSYMNQQTTYRKAFLGKGRVSIGSFESPSCEAKVINNRDYVFMRNATGIGAASIFSALAIRRQLEMAASRLGIDQQITQKLQKGLDDAQKSVDAQTQELQDMSRKVQDAQNSITDMDANSAVESVRQEAIDAQRIGERASSHAGDFRESSQAYIKSDKANVEFATKQANEAEAYVNANSNGGNPLTRFIDAIRKKAEMKTDNSQLIAEAQNNANAYYNASNTISHAGVDHGVVSSLESTMQTAANNSDIATLDATADILEKISQIGSANSGRIDLSQFIDLSSISSACKEHGVDILSIVAPVILGANKAIDDNSRNR